MRFLFLINNAPGHREFFNRVAGALRTQGHEVEFALDSRYSHAMSRGEPLAGPVHVFSEYFQARRESAEMPRAYESLDIWRLLYSDIDRWRYGSTMYRSSPDYYQSLMRCLLCFFDEMFGTRRFDGVVYENVSNGFAAAAYTAAKEHGVAYIGFAASRLPGRTDVIDDVTLRHTEVAKTFAAFLSNPATVSTEASHFADGYLASFERIEPDYMKTNETLEAHPLKRYARLAPINTLVKSLVYRVLDSSDYDHAFQIGDPFVEFPRYFFTEWSRLRRVKYLFRDTYDHAVPGERFALYPIQYHPESTVSVDGVFHDDERTTIERILLCLPHSTMLYVKDHRFAAGRQSDAFYAWIRRLPNVRLIHPLDSAKTLIRNCEFVVANTSSMGFEALILRKPVVVLGRPFYDFHPGVMRIGDWNDGAAIFRAVRDVSVNEAQVRALVQAYFAWTLPGVYDLRRPDSEPAYIDTISAGIVAEARRSALARAAAEGRPERFYGE